MKKSIYYYFKNMIGRCTVADIVKCFLSTMIISIGVVIFIECSLGSDAFTVFLDGIKRTFNIPVSVIDELLCLIFLITSLILNKEKVGITTIVNALVIGLCIELSYTLLAIFNLNINNQNLVFRFTYLIFAQILMSFGYAWLQTFASGMNSIDAIIYYFVEKFKLKYFVIKSTIDILFLIIGYLLGGIVGIGTIISVCTTGLFISIIKKVIENKNINNCCKA